MIKEKKHLIFTIKSHETFKVQTHLLNNGYLYLTYVSLQVSTSLDELKMCLIETFKNTVIPIVLLEYRKRTITILTNIAINKICDESETIT